IFVNREFNVLQSLIDEVVQRFDAENADALRPLCSEHVEAVYSMQLVYTVMTARATFRLRTTWDAKSYATLVSPESLTACVLPRISMRQEIRRRVNSDPRLRAFRARSEAAAS